jgi:abortive infection bacteriophage resistance protein
MKYNKPPLTCTEHLNLLQTRGLVVNDEIRAIQYLSTIGYYRLTGYMYHLQKHDGSHLFQGKISFDEIIVYYQFDKKLRVLLLDYLERIEVALRAKLIDKFSLQYGFYWYMDEKLYEDKKTYQLILETIKAQFDNPQEIFLKKFKYKYTSEDFPPSNMALEILSLGKLARLYKGLANNKEKISIAEDFGLTSTIMSSWCIYLTNVRNACAHHARLWNRKISADRPLIPRRKEYCFSGNLPEDFNTTVYGIVSMIYRLLLKINSKNSFIDNFTNLLEEYPAINTASMGFPTDWRSNPAWRKADDPLVGRRY